MQAQGGASGGKDGVLENRKAVGVCGGVSCSRERDEQGDFGRAAGALRAMVWSLDYILRAIQSSGKFRQGSGVITSYYEDVDF